MYEHRKVTAQWSEIHNDIWQTSNMKNKIEKTDIKT